MYYYGKPRNIKKLFFFFEEQMDNKVFQEIFNKSISFINIIFTDIYNMDTFNFTNEKIRLEPEMENKLKFRET